MLIISIASFLVSALVFMAAKSAIHEILAGVLAMIAAIFWVGAAIVAKLEEQVKASRELVDSQPGKARPPSSLKYKAE